MRGVRKSGVRISPLPRLRHGVRDGGRGYVDSRRDEVFAKAASTANEIVARLHPRRTRSGSVFFQFSHHAHFLLFFAKNILREERFYPLHPRDFFLNIMDMPFVFSKVWSNTILSKSAV